MPFLLASMLQDTLVVAQSRFPRPLKDCKVICIPTAANVYAPEKRAWLDEEMNIVRAAGAVLDVFDIEGKSAAEVAEKITQADVVYVTGGNIDYLLEHMQKCDFLAAIQPFLQRGGLYIGASAGTVVMCPRIDFISHMDDIKLSSITSCEGLSLVPFLIMVHTDHTKYAPMVKELLPLIPPHETVIALTDAQALWVNENIVELVQA